MSKMDTKDEIATKFDQLLGKIAVYTAIILYHRYCIHWIL